MSNIFLYANREQQTKESTVSFRQRAVIEFLVKEEIPAAEIHQRLQAAYGNVCMGASSVRRWVKHFKEGVFSNSQNGGRNVYKEVAIMWKNKERSVD
jgi:hypothetical protein